MEVVAIEHHPDWAGPEATLVCPNCLHRTYADAEGLEEA